MKRIEISKYFGEENSPLLNRFTFRQVEGDRDIEAMQKIHLSCRECDQTDPYSVCYQIPNLDFESYRKEVKQAPIALLVLEGDEVVAHGWLEVWGFEERLYLWRVWVMPRVRGLGLGTIMLRWGENFSRQLNIAEGKPMLHLANATEGEADAVELLLHEGYHLSFVSPELSFEDFGSLAAVSTPVGVDLLPLKSETIRDVARAMAEANIDSPGIDKVWSDEELRILIDREEAEWVDRVSEADPALSPVAWAGNEVAGAFLCKAGGEVGEISQVAVRKGWRGQGLARILCTQSLHLLGASGCKTARLFTSKDAGEDEPSVGTYAMYRKFGFKPIARHLRFRKAGEREKD